MRRRFVMAAGLLAAPIVALALAHGADPKAPKPPGPSPSINPLDKDCPDGQCGKHGTTVAFEDSPSDAAKKAKKEEKLVLVLHVSGIFEDPKLT